MPSTGEKYFPNKRSCYSGPVINYWPLMERKKSSTPCGAVDNTASIAKKNHVTVTNLVKWNNLRHNKVIIGQQLAIFIPEKKNSSPKQAVASLNNQKDKALANMSDSISISPKAEN